ncbi:hypothetical protein [Silvanigrella aquatica]|uniref:Uncharacterized protein n=1 Tax=Silvanigrella aquatica TaxID=1915309 RepID=A0A1L4CY18_9BACT|nr:hypothetical protein [Silvanigrella aquatica]APJ02838.1 hypothetical protein AXG55_02445 [Silvanigrella aquatica]
MISIFIFLLKQYWSFILICILGTVAGVYFGGLWTFLPFIFLILFFYEWNIAPRKEKTWYFFDSLPLSFFKRYFLRVLTPFIFSFIIIFVLTYFQKENEHDIIKSLSDGLRISSLFILSSILAQSMSGFLAWTIISYFVCYLFSAASFYEVATVIYCLALSYYYLSGKRVSKFKSVYLPILICILVLSLGSSYKLKVYEYSLFIPIHQLQIKASQSLIENRAFLGKNLVVDWNEGADPNSAPVKVLVPSIYNDKLLTKIESIVLSESTCSVTCNQLADLVSNFPKNWNQERLEKYLNSNNEVEQTYALEILDGALQPLFYKRVIQLVKSQNSEVSALAISLLRKWGDDNTSATTFNNVF